MSSRSVRIDYVPTAVQDQAVGSDKTFTVPAGEEWELVQLYAQVLTTATVGNRLTTVEVQDDNSVLLSKIAANAVQAASLDVGYNFAPGLQDQPAIVGKDINTAHPASVLGPGYKLRAYDQNAVDLSGDTVDVRVLVKRRRR